jgi:hypothetical protein
MGEEAMSPFRSETSFSVKESKIMDASDADLEKWASDPNCRDQEKCSKALGSRRALRERVKQAKIDNPFDPRTDVSADAKYITREIIKHLWILFVLLPVITFGLLLLTGAIK